MTEEPDNLTALVEEASLAAEQGKSASQVRMEFVMKGVDGDTADAIVFRVFNDKPLSERYRESSAEAVNKISRAENVGGISWTVWIGVLVAINVLSWLFNWPFWIY